MVVMQNKKKKTNIRVKTGMSEKGEKGAEVLYFPSNCGDEAQMFANRR